MPKLIDWFSRNFVLLITGLVLLPISLYALLLFIGFGYGFVSSANAEFNWVLVFMLLLGLHPFVFGFSVKFCIQSYRKNGTYAYWDFIPITYFFVIFVSFFLGRF